MSHSCVAYYYFYEFCRIPKWFLKFEFFVFFRLFYFHVIVCVCLFFLTSFDCSCNLVFYGVSIYKLFSPHTHTHTHWCWISNLLNRINILSLCVFANSISLVSGLKLNFNWLTIDWMYKCIDISRCYSFVFHFTTSFDDDQFYIHTATKASLVFNFVHENGCFFPFYFIRLSFRFCIEFLSWRCRS